MRRILVVGGSSGIGAAALEILLEQHEVINISRNAPQQSHAHLIHHGLDVIEDELPELDRLDGLIYCPGSINLKPFGRLKEKDFLNDFQINVWGAVRVLQHFEKALKNGENPSVVLFSTIAVPLGMTFHASVAVAKGGVEGLMRSLAAEWAPAVRVNAIAPTITDTPMAAKILRNDAMKEKMNERHPLKHYLGAKEVAKMAVYLLSEDGAAISGQRIPMDCGLQVIH